MVYAAAFGISDRVMRELAKAYPQVNDPAWLDANASNSLFYWNYRPYGWYSHRHNGPFDHDAAGQMDRALAAQLRLTEAHRLPADSPTSARS